MKLGGHFTSGMSGFSEGISSNAVKWHWQGNLVFELPDVRGYELTDQGFRAGR